jgi:quercetin dioxygenase-like cupin family protein
MLDLRRLVVVAIVAAMVLAVAACGGDDDDAGWSAFAPSDEIVRDVFAAGEPESADGQLLELTRVIIPGGMEIAPHTHPGLQLAVILQGTLTYTVIEGEVNVTHDTGTDQARTETIGAGETVELVPGSAVVEMPGMVHMAKNEGNMAVVVNLASLFPVDAPASSPAN